MMNKEEIEINLLLEEIKYGVKTKRDRNEIKVDGIGYKWEELNILLDYITNLQQENKQLKEELRVTIECSDFWNDKTNQLQERIDKASSNLKRNYWINEHEHNDDVVNLTLKILGDSNE